MYKKTTLTSVSVLVLLLLTSFAVRKSSTGIAGYTGAPGELNCSAPGCHGGGSSAATNITITAVPSFSNDQYMADSTYVITVAVSASGYNRYGFDCEILDSTLQNAGTMQAAGPGVKFLNAGVRKNATHTSPKLGVGGTTFNFQWVAPSDGKALFYLSCNCVNFNGNTSGDLVLPFFMSLYPAPVEPVDTTTVVDGISGSKELLSGFYTYPNPAKDLLQLQYSLRKNGVVRAELWELSGRQAVLLFEEKQPATQQSKILDISQVPPGVYFLRLSCDGRKLSQKLISVN